MMVVVAVDVVAELFAAVVALSFVVLSLITGHLNEIPIFVVPIHSAGLVAGALVNADFG